MKGIFVADMMLSYRFPPQYCVLVLLAARIDAVTSE